MKLELNLLKFMRAAGDLLTPEEQLRDDVRLSVSPMPTGSAISAALNELYRRGWAVDLRDEVTGIVKWRITQDGLAELAIRKL